MTGYSAKGGDDDMTDKKPASGDVELTDDLLDRLAEEAEKGYEVENLRPRARRGRPPLGAAAATPFQVRLEPELRDALQREAKRLNMSPSEVVRTALREHIERSPDPRAAVERRRSESSAPAEDGERRVLLVARTLASADRLLDLVPYLVSVRGVTVRVTIDRGAGRVANLDERLGRAGVDLLPWREAAKISFDVVIAAHASRDLATFRHSNLIVMPHGAGYNRMVTAGTGDGADADGLSEDELADRRGIVFPSVIGVANVEQMNDLAETNPSAIPKAVVIGDPSFDRLQVSSARREEFRRRLGVGVEQRLVMVSSTWGEHSLLRRYPNFVEQLVSQLPIDQYKVVLVQHPNILSDPKISEHEITQDAAVANGLFVLPPSQGAWRAALIASDVVVGDHGSITFYAAGLGKPLLDVGVEEFEAAPGSSLADFTALSPKVDVSGDLRRQVESAVDDHDTSWFESIGRRMFVLPGESIRVLLSQVYALMGLPEPKRHPRPRPILTTGVLRGDPPRSTLVFTTLRSRDRRSADALVERFPAKLAELAQQHPDRILLCQWGETQTQLLGSAQVHVRDDVLDAKEAQRWTASMLESYPRASLAAAADSRTSCVLRTRDGRMRSTNY
jgi:predicted transcriptional regulator